MLAAVDAGLDDRPEPAPRSRRRRVAIGLALASFGATWCLALLVTGLIDAWRSVAMTFEAERRLAAARPATVDAGTWRARTGPRPDGTFGASSGRRPGDWSADNPGGSL